MTDGTLPVVVVGLLFGIQHATDPDHVLAVATIVSRTRRFGSGALIGAFWGLGHTATVGAVGVAILVLNLAVTPALGLAMELAVAAMLMLLGALRIAWVFRDTDPVPVEHLTEPHPDEGAETFHSHVHAHGGVLHRHPHVHPVERLARVLGEVGLRQALSSALVGVVQGLAGSAALALLLLSTIRSVPDALAYLALFGAGTILGMTGITALLSLPFTLRTPVLLRWRRGLVLGTGALSVAFGLYLALQVGFADPVFLGRAVWQPR
ncbi:MAG TPA: high-affinity nickel-transport family protein [Methylomirabilota bacterium]|nr:high-affinity nickel-transport family protein [Methylomirabilota bacterium]